MATYTTKAGDMWDAIAYEQLGSTNYTARLMNLNQQYGDIYIFPFGIVLTLPERIERINSSLPPWKQKGAGV